MRSIAKLLVLVLLAGIGNPSARAQLTVLCEGDSITYGTYVSTPYPSRLARITGHHVINAGLGGERAAGGLGRIGGLLSAYDPWVVLILYGTNDINGYGDLHQTAQTILRIAQSVQAGGATPVIGTVPPQIGPSAGRMGRVNELNGWLRSYARSYGIALADIQAAFGSGSGLMVFDGFHPNDTGAEIIAQTFAARIPAILLMPASVQIPDAGVTGRVFRVGTRLSWTATASQPWITITSAASGTGSGTITFSVDENIGPARSGNITVAGGGQRANLTVNQKASPSLKITSQYGIPVPAAGTVWMRSGTVTNACMGGSPFLAGVSTQYVHTGWTGTGSAPKTGTDTNTGPFAVTNTSTITWLWKTNYWLETGPCGSGTVNVTSGWFARGSRVTLRATPDAGSRFFRWTGASSLSASSIVVSMTCAKSVFAWFGVDLSVQARGLDGSIRKVAVQVAPDVFQKAAGTTPCKFAYTNRAAVTLHAPETLKGGWKLAGWTGVDSSDGTRAVWTALSSNQVTVLYDPVPTVTITNPTRSASWTTTNAAVTIRGRASGFGGLTRIEISNTRAERNQICTGTTNWSYEGLSLYPGLNTITVTAYDTYNNTAVDTLKINCTRGKAVQSLTLLAGAVVRDIQMPDNLVPGTTNTILWQIESYEPVRSGLKIRLPEGPGVTNVTINGRPAGSAPGTWTIGGLVSQILSFEADWIVPNRPGTCRVRFPTARLDGFAYVNAGIPDGVESAPYGVDGKEIARTIAAGGTSPALQHEALTKDVRPFEKIADAQRRAGVVIRDIDIPDNLVPGSIVTCRWTTLSYPAVATRLRCDLPTETDMTGTGRLKRNSNSVWRLPTRGTIVEYDGTVTNDASGASSPFYRMVQRDMYWIWTVPNDPGLCRINFDVAPAKGNNGVEAVLRQGVDARIETNRTQILRDIAADGAAPALLTMSVTNTAGNIQYFGDADWYQFTVDTAGMYRIQTYLGTLKDTILKLYGPGNQNDLIGQNDNAVGRASRLTLPLNPGTYYIKITAPLNRKGTYRIVADPSL